DFVQRHNVRVIKLLHNGNLFPYQVPRICLVLTARPRTSAAESTSPSASSPASRAADEVGVGDGAERALADDVLDDDRTEDADEQRDTSGRAAGGGSNGDARLSLVDDDRLAQSPGARSELCGAGMSAESGDVASKAGEEAGSLNVHGEPSPAPVNNVVPPTGGETSVDWAVAAGDAEHADFAAGDAGSVARRFGVAAGVFTTAPGAPSPPATSVLRTRSTSPAAPAASGEDTRRGMAAVGGGGFRRAGRGF
ncbi:MAG: hypothetical protein BJ554DRAFT_1292, partial [Olpidium bornovanus]